MEDGLCGKLTLELDVSSSSMRNVMIMILLVVMMVMMSDFKIDKIPPQKLEVSQPKADQSSND